MKVFFRFIEKAPINWSVKIKKHQRRFQLLSTMRIWRNMLAARNSRRTVFMSKRRRALSWAWRGQQWVKAMKSYNLQIMNLFVRRIRTLHRNIVGQAVAAQHKRHRLHNNNSNSFGCRTSTAASCFARKSGIHRESRRCDEGKSKFKKKTFKKKTILGVHENRLHSRQECFDEKTS